MDTGRNAAPVVHNVDNVARQYFHINLGAETGERLINGVIHNFINEVVKALGSGRADVHAGPFAHRFQAFEYLYLIFIVILIQLFQEILLRCFCISLWWML